MQPPGCTLAQPFGCDTISGVTDAGSSELTVPASAEETWDALTDPRRLADWLADGAELDLRPGGELAVSVDGEQRGGFFEEVDSPRRLVFWWGPEGDEPTRVEIELEPDDDGTRVRVVESRPLRVLDARGIEVESWLGGDSSPQMRAPELSAIC
jgi:uncharacterized protein YndB with AHSA1/START domain